MNHGVSAIAILIVFVSLTDNPLKVAAQLQGEQSSFSAETVGVDRPVPIPNKVTTILARDERVASFLKSEGLTPEQMPKEWFSASIVHLSDTNSPDLVVKAEAPILGANITTFWIFRHAQDGYQLLLEAHGHDLSVMRTSHGRYRNIQVSGKTASEYSSTTYRFSGVEYKANDDSGKHR